MTCQSHTARQRGPCSGCLGFVFSRFDKTLGHRNDCHEKKKFIILADPEKQEAWPNMPGPTGKHQGLSGGGGSKGKVQVRTFTMVSPGRNG